MTIPWGGGSVARFADNGNQGLAQNCRTDDGLSQDMNYGPPDPPVGKELT